MSCQVLDCGLRPRGSLFGGVQAQVGLSATPPSTPGVGFYNNPHRRNKGGKLAFGIITKGLWVFYQPNLIELKGEVLIILPRCSYDRTIVENPNPVPFPRDVPG